MPDSMCALEVWFYPEGSYHIEEYQEEDSGRVYYTVKRITVSKTQPPVTTVELLLKKTYSHAEAWDAVNKARKGG